MIGLHRSTATGVYQYGGPTPYADFDQSYDAINGNDAAGSRYFVRAGDTLQSIAQTVWGDSSLWYLIADANGLTSDAELAEGMSLLIPNKVVPSENPLNRECGDSGGAGRLGQVR